MRISYFAREASLALKKKVSKSDLAEVMGISYRSVQRFESGEWFDELLTITNLCKVLEVNPGDLLKEDGSSNLAAVIDAYLLRQKPRISKSELCT